MRKLEPHIVNGYLQSFLEGKEEGFDYFFRVFHKALCFFANRYLNDLPAAEDIVSDSFLKVWVKKAQIRNENHLKNYLYKTVYHACLRLQENEKRKIRDINGFLVISDKEEKSYLENITRAEIMRQLKEAMDQLPVKCREIFYKLYIEGKTVADAAEELRLSVNTIKTQKARGLKLMKLRLGSGFVIILFNHISS
jgi:RNA polymerase sigma-70 factor (ECF subfamily)